MWISFEVRARDLKGLLEEFGLLVSPESKSLGVEKGGCSNTVWCERSFLSKISKVGGEGSVPEFPLFV